MKYKRYIITWFREFSEYEKQDFQEILVKWLLNKNEAMQVNGFTENCSKPTIFHCRVCFYLMQLCDNLFNFNLLCVGEIVQGMVHEMA